MMHENVSLIWKLWFVLQGMKDITTKHIETLRPIGRHFVDDIFKCIFLNENIKILINISLEFILKSQINNTPSLVQIMAWRWPGNKPLHEPMIFSLLAHICVSRPQWVNHVRLSKQVLNGKHFEQNIVLHEFSWYPLKTYIRWYMDGGE